MTLLATITQSRSQNGGRDVNPLTHDVIGCDDLSGVQSHDCSFKRVMDKSVICIFDEPLLINLSAFGVSECTHKVLHGAKFRCLQE